MSRRPQRSVAQNPVLVGAVTLLVTCIAVFLAYNANRGLPFVPTHAVRVQLPNGGRLAPGNEVREGGFRIGIVEAMRPIRLPGGRPAAEATLKLDEAAWPLPRDSTFAVRGRSVLGLKYLDIHRGTSTASVGEDGVLTADGPTLSVELDRVLGMFDAATRRGARRMLEGYGQGLAGRGLSLNTVLSDAPSLLRNLDAVMAVLARPSTRIGPLIVELRDTARALGPVADRYAHSFAAGADTFAALSADPQSLDETLRRIPPTLLAGKRVLPGQRPLLRALGDLSTSLGTTARQLPSVLPRLTSFARTGAAALPDGTHVATETLPVVRELNALAAQPSSTAALEKAIATNSTLAPLTRYVGPYITVCNYFTYGFGFAADTGSEADLTGTTGRTMVIVPPRSDNSMGTIGASEPANGQNVTSGAGGFLHRNVYSAAVDRQGNADCESGQRGYLSRLNAFGDPRYKIVIDPHVPGNQGPTYSGSARVPDGLTFSRAPELGPRMPTELDP